MPASYQYSLEILLVFEVVAVRVRVKVEFMELRRQPDNAQ